MLEFSRIFLKFGEYWKKLNLAEFDLANKEKKAISFQRKTCFLSKNDVESAWKVLLLK